MSKQTLVYMTWYYDEKY